MAGRNKTARRARNETVAATAGDGGVQDLPWAIPPSVETGPESLVRALRERIKELNCLYAMARLAERHQGSLDDLLQQIVEILPPSWQYPDAACARIRFENRVYRSRGYRRGVSAQSADIAIHGRRAGDVTVCYTDARPAADEGPFLREERALIEAVAERIGTMATRWFAERELQESNRQLDLERQSLHEANTALRTVLRRIEEEKREIYRDIQAHVAKVLMPILHALAMDLPPPQRKYVALLRENLEDITSPFVSRLSQQFQSLTPTEISICTMIRAGLRSKEIAEMRGVTSATISRHRENIRRKLGIVNEAINLTTLLQNTGFESQGK